MGADTLTSSQSLHKGAEALEGAVARILDRRLEAHARAPLVVAFSGGGDSLALLLIAKAWADKAGRRLIAVTVDHRLQTSSAEWARWCAERAGRLGLEHRTLVWDGPKPAAGLPAAAREARHGLLAETARAAGAVVILMGHTADDCLEAAAMRAAGSTTPTPREWSPSPVWPEGRDLFLLRPLLDLRRAALRDWLAARGESWIEDPANDDPRFARARARREPPHQLAPEPVCRTGELPLQIEAAVGELVAPRGAFAKDPARALLAALLLCASGTDRPPRGARLDRLLTALRGGEPLVAGLSGARIEADHQHVRVMREPGELRRRGIREVALTPGAAMVWDGRFELTARCAGLALRPLGGLASRLAKAETAALRAVHPVARRTLPALVDEAGSVTCPILATGGEATVRSLVLGRLSAALGAIQDEASIWRVAKDRGTS